MRIDRHALMFLASVLLASVFAASAAAQSMPATAQPSRSASSEPGTGTQNLPEDVRGYILKHRMCAHFQKDATAKDAETRAASARMAKSLCAGADAATWKTLVRKYEGQDTITGILLAERPSEIKMDASKLK